ncbi:hypothetical protein [Comamonas sp. BIGb0124]|uniref:hypothetical protein n=1 Tax=Comamonas sp. BIGb0124 TaxID=2485130 RepID=UPI001315A2A2|nr:hypothetical protein [Comamonas sp. BIGb0124]
MHRQARQNHSAQHGCPAQRSDRRSSRPRTAWHGAAAIGPAVILAIEPGAWHA